MDLIRRIKLFGSARGWQRVRASLAWRWRRQRSNTIRWWDSRQRSRFNRQTAQAAARPGQALFTPELEYLLGCDDHWLHTTALEYYHSQSWQRLSAANSVLVKTLDVAEGFALWALVKWLRPGVVVEVGTQYGYSARLWKDALKTYVPEHELILCDLKDKRHLIGDDESTFIEGDARQTLPPILATRQVDLLYNDAHPYSLTRWSVEEGLRQGVTAFAFHDVGRGKRGPFQLKGAALSPQEKAANDLNWAEFGHWERHVMADLFDEQLLYTDAASSRGFRVQIFDSLFGFGVVLRQSSD